MFIVWKSRKSTGSGDVLQQPPKNSGYATCSQRDDHPPEECPRTILPAGLATARNRRSISGINSFTNASPTGPLFAELANTECPSGTSGSKTTVSALYGQSPRRHLSPSSPARKFVALKCLPP